MNAVTPSSTLPTEAVFARSGDVLTTSQTVAQVFGKQHGNVLRNIERLIATNSDLSSSAWFRKCAYVDAKGESRPCCEMTRDALSMLTMGFTGAKAVRWKVLFIQAFNHMEAQIRAALPAPTAGELSAAEYHRIGGIVKAVTSKAIDDRLAPIENKLRRIANGIVDIKIGSVADPRIAAVEYRPMIEVLIDLGVSAKGRRGISVCASARLRRWAIDRDRAAGIRCSRETGKYLFQVDMVDAWLKAEGRALIAAHQARLEGQPALPLRSKRPKPSASGGSV